MPDTYLEIDPYAGTNPILIPFPYLDPSHIEVKVNDVVQVLNTPGQTGSYEIHGTTNEVFFLTVPSNGDAIRISRVTPSTPLVDWHNQTAISGSGLDNTVKQPLYAIEEVREVGVYNGTWDGDIISTAKGGTGNATGRAVGSSVDVTNNRSHLYTYWPVMVGGLLQSGPEGVSKIVYGDFDLSYIPSTIGPGITGDPQVQGELSGVEMAAYSFITLSDERVKKNIEDSDVGLEFINSLRPVKFQFKRSTDLSGSEEDYIRNAVITGDGREKHGTQQKYGFIAQELKEAIESHSPGSDIGWNGGVDKAEGVSGTKLVAPLVKAVQELSQKVEELEARIVQLEPN